MFEEYRFHHHYDLHDLHSDYDKLTPEEQEMVRMKAAILSVFTYITAIILALLLCLLLGSCSVCRNGIATTIPVETVHADTVRITQLQRDSIFVGSVQHDSVALTQRGDTILIDRWHTLTLTEYRDRLLHDTTYVATHDTVPRIVEVEKEVKVEKPLTWWQQARLRLANILLWVLGIYAAVWIIRKRSWWTTIIRKIF